MDHHAYVVTNNGTDKIWAFLEKNLKFVKQANPDASEMVAETFGVDEARILKDWAYKKSFGEMKVAVISSNLFTNEAQNALLKLFEEPTPNTYFFLSTNNLGSILPTLLSRMQILEIGDAKDDSNDEKIATKFINSSVGERLKAILPIVKDKDKVRAVNLIAGILHITRSEEVLKAEKYIKSRSPYIKMVLEHLAITLPQNV